MPWRSLTTTDFPVPFEREKSWRQTCEGSEVTPPVRVGLGPGSGTPFPKAVVLNFGCTLEHLGSFSNVHVSRPCSRPVKSECLQDGPWQTFFFSPKEAPTVRQCEPNIPLGENYCIVQKQRVSHLSTHHNHLEVLFKPHIARPQPKFLNC